jgi:hypothetical protein
VSWSDPPTDQVIDLAERRRAVHRVRVNSGGDGRARIPHLSQASVDGVHIHLADRGQSGLIQAALLDVREVEGAIACDRTAQAGPVLLLVHRQLCPRERVGPVERIVAEEAVRRASHRIRPALGDHTDISAERAAEFRLPA